MHRAIIIPMSPRKQQKRRRPKPRLPLAAALRLRKHSVESKKGKKGYDRKLAKAQTVKNAESDFFEENS